MRSFDLVIRGPYSSSFPYQVCSHDANSLVHFVRSMLQPAYSFDPSVIPTIFHNGGEYPGEFRPTFLLFKVSMP